MKIKWNGKRKEGNKAEGRKERMTEGKEMKKKKKEVTGKEERRPEKKKKKKKKTIKKKR